MSKLFYTVESGTANPEQLKQFFDAKGYSVRQCVPYKDPMYGSIVFQKKDHRNNAFQHHKQIEIDNAIIRLTEGDPRSDQPSKKQDDTQAGSAAQPQASTSVESFFNPYHFVDVEGFTPRYPFVPHDRFSGHNGRLTVEIECTTPLFIPDPEQTRYIISDQTLLDEDDPQPFVTAVHETINAFITKHKIPATALPLEVFFDPECRKWDRQYPNNHLLAWKPDYDKTPPSENSHWARGEICKAADGTWHIRTDDPDARRYAHKEMDFFRVNGQPVIPGSSLRGAVRNRLEVLSNACFCGYDNQEHDVSYMFRRLDILKKKERDEAARLTPVVLRNNGGNWSCVEVDQARVLSEHIFNRAKSSGTTELGAFFNLEESCYEKISITGSMESGRETGLNAYRLKKKRKGRIDTVNSKGELTTEFFEIKAIKGQPLTRPRNLYNKTFAFIHRESVGRAPLYAIIRRLRLPKGGNIFKIKSVSSRMGDLEEKLPKFKSAESNPKVTYAISNIKIKTSFDIDTKTQHRAYFIFGATQFDDAVNRREVQVLSSDQIDQFTSLLQQRKQNAAKLPSDPEGINRRLAQELREQPHNDMLAYFSPQGRYLTPKNCKLHNLMLDN